MCRWAFSMTTIASSTTSPVARVIPKSVSELIEKSKILTNASPNQRHRDCDRRDNRGSPVEQEQKNHNDDDENGFFQGSNNFLDRIAYDRRRIEGNHVLDSR